MHNSPSDHAPITPHASRFCSRPTCFLRQAFVSRGGMGQAVHDESKPVDDESDNSGARTRYAQSSPSPWPISPQKSTERHQGVLRDLGGLGGEFFVELFAGVGRRTLFGSANGRAGSLRKDTASPSLRASLERPRSLGETGGGVMISSRHVVLELHADLRDERPTGNGGRHFEAVDHELASFREIGAFSMTNGASMRCLRPRTCTFQVPTLC